MYNHQIMGAYNKGKNETLPEKLRAKLTKETTLWRAKFGSVSNY